MQIKVNSGRSHKKRFIIDFHDFQLFDHFRGEHVCYKFKNKYVKVLNILLSKKKKKIEIKKHTIVSID